jgi:hypothetical protein
MRKKLAAAAVGASLLAGAGAGAALMTPVVATAADSGSSDSGSSDSGSSGAGSEPGAERPAPGQWVEDALQGLVDDGTITEAQSSAVADALAAARPKGGPMGRFRHGHGPGLEVAATAIGIEVDALRSALQDGQTIAEVAAANDVDVQNVIDAIAADMKEHLDEAVDNGRLTQERADEMKANAEERATALVNGERPAGGPGFGPPPGAPGSPDESST